MKTRTLLSSSVIRPVTSEPAYIKLSKDHFKQIVLNLVKNALESMEPGGRLSIISERNGDKITIKVNDTGKGMPPEVLEQLFTPFFR